MFGSCAGFLEGRSIGRVGKFRHSATVLCYSLRVNSTASVKRSGRQVGISRIALVLGAMSLLIVGAGCERRQKSGAAPMARGVPASGPKVQLENEKESQADILRIDACVYLVPAPE